MTSTIDLPTYLKSWVELTYEFVLKQSNNVHVEYLSGADAITRYPFQPDDNVLIVELTPSAVETVQFLDDAILVEGRVNESSVPVRIPYLTIIGILSRAPNVFITPPLLFTPPSRLEHPTEAAVVHVNFSNKDH